MTQPAVQSARLPPRSGRARPEFAWEPFGDCIVEAQPLLHRHWEEVALNKGSIALDPDWDTYFALASAGRLHVLTARVEGRLVGYLSMVMGRLLHYRQVLWAESDIFWLDPSWRLGMTGIHLFKLGEQGMRSLGCRRIDFTPKLHFEAERGGVGRILEHLGYKPIETTYSKTFEDAP